MTFTSTSSVEPSPLRIVYIFKCIFYLVRIIEDDPHEMEKKQANFYLGFTQAWALIARLQFVSFRGVTAP